MLGFARGVSEEGEGSTGKNMEGSMRRVRAAEMAHGGAVVRRCSGEQLPVRESEREREKEGATFLTSRRSSGGGLSSSKSGGAGDQLRRRSGHDVRQRGGTGESEGGAPEQVKERGGAWVHLL